jgi:hypothetical protein
MVEKLVVSAESLLNAEKAVTDLESQIEKASPMDRPAWQGRLDAARRQLELLKQGTRLGK